MNTNSLHFYFQIGLPLTNTNSVSEYIKFPIPNNVMLLLPSWLFLYIIYFCALSEWENNRRLFFSSIFRTFSMVVFSFSMEHYFSTQVSYLHHFSALLSLRAERWLVVWLLCKFIIYQSYFMDQHVSKV